MGPGRRYYDVVVVHGSFDLQEGELIPSEGQSPPVLADTWWNAENAALSSVKAAGNALLYKPATDILVTGNAQAPYGIPQSRWQAGVLVSSNKSVLVRNFLTLTGPRSWQHGFLRGWHLTEPTLVESVPLRYELAYGGARPKPQHESNNQPGPQWDTYKPNPSGTGFFDERRLSRNTLYAGPQLEMVDRPIREINRNYPLTGFGPVARFWSARTKYAGTYDADWRRGLDEAIEQGLPGDYPGDFDVRFFQCAPPQLICPGHLRGNEMIGLGNMLSEAPHFSTHLPGLRVHAHILSAALPSQPPPQPMRLDTVQIDLDTRRVALTWRLSLFSGAGVQSIALEMEKFT